jgi:hypothetical protein
LNRCGLLVIATLYVLYQEAAKSRISESFNWIRDVLATDTNFDLVVFIKIYAAGNARVEDFVFSQFVRNVKLFWLFGLDLIS